jgi:hypothetical protein
LHGLLGGIERGAGEPSRLVFRGHFFYEELELIFPLDRGGRQQVLDDLEHADDVTFLGGAEFCDQEDCGCE